jgi:hypothetical protein
LPVVFLTGVKLGLRVFENRVLRRIFGIKMEKVVKAGEECLMRSLASEVAKYNLDLMVM